MGWPKHEEATSVRLVEMTYDWEKAVSDFFYFGIVFHDFIPLVFELFEDYLSADELLAWRVRLLQYRVCDGPCGI